MLSREEAEQLEAQRLAPYAQRSGTSRGRAYPEAEHAYRTAFQRDRDRVLHTTAFRRLEYKTQVFVNHEGDHYRTRLTHTLEVAQIARTVARALRVNEDLVEAIAMAHDLGHTPFGHAGEAALSEMMAGKGGFNHNTHGLRIVEKLEKRYPDFPGLNLTWEVREGIIKHATDYDAPEAGDYEPECRATLEGQIINLADEIAYNAHDLDDGLRSGLIQARQLRGLMLWDAALAALDVRGADEINSVDRSRIIRYLIDLEVTDLITATEARLHEVRPASVEGVRDQPRDMVCFSTAMSQRNRELKGLLMTDLYRHWRVMRMAQKARRMLTRLFRAYADAPQQLPSWVQALIDGERVERVVCDYVAGMTDRFAQQEYRSMFESSERV
ncbi:MAG: deoxyguanosinetriphosphate triphosphohydrolase [Anaerolineales bacterium]|nr:MAG: deoxyguanosinetriphosphate triphosphohydrolase [Anaerolineales bacterium]